MFLKSTTIIARFKISFEYFLFFGIIFCLLISCDDSKKESYEPVIVKEKSTVFVSTEQIPDTHFLGDENCKECHQEQFNDWEGSHHDKAMQIATRNTILADFNGEKFKSQGVSSRFFKNGVSFSKFSAICFETQNFPDAPNNKIFPTSILRPWEEYINEAVFKFSIV